MPTPLTVVGLYAENTKRLRVVHVEPPATGLVKVAGRNGQGKSSLLDAIVMALGGKNVQPDVPIRRGAKHAKVVLDLGELRVTRTWTEADSYLTVERRGPHGQQDKLRRPQDLLDSLIGAGLGFDPLEFVERLKPAEQVSTLLRLLQLPEDPRALDVQKRRLYEERTALHREIRALEAKLAGLPEPTEALPDEEISIAELAQEHARLVAVHHANNETRAELDRVAADYAHAVAKVDRLTRALAEARARLQTVGDRHVRLLEAVAALQDPDLTAITRQMQDAEALNARIRQQRARAAVAADLLAKQREAADLTEALQALEERKRTLLAGATFPVPGLGFEEVEGEYRVTYHGVPLEQASDSERIRVGLGIAMALNPTVRVIIVRTGALLDPDTLAMIEQTVTAAGYQVWIELVGEGPADAIVIEDGGVIRLPGPPTAPAPASPATLFTEEE